MAIEPTAVTTHDSREIAPTCAMLVGSMMMPDPIMLTATMKVSWIRLIRFGWSMMPPPSRAVRDLPSCFLCQAIDQVASTACGLLEPQAVNIGLESGEFLVELPGIEQIVLDRLGGLGDALARHDHRNAGRIGNHHHRHGPAEQMVDLHALDPPAHQPF